MVTINKNFASVFKQIHDNAKKNFKTLLFRVGEGLVTETDLGFIDSISPYGKRWKSLKPETIKARRKGPNPGSDRILVDSGRMQSSVNHVEKTFFRKVLTIGSNDNEDKVLTHIFGNTAKNVPARPFLPNSNVLPKTWESILLEEFDWWTNEVFP